MLIFQLLNSLRPSYVNKKKLNNICSSLSYIIDSYSYGPTLHISIINLFSHNDR